MWNGRDYLAGKFLLDPSDEASKQASIKNLTTVKIKGQTTVVRNAKDMGNGLSPILFYSQDTHYSIIKSAIVLRLKTFFDVGNEKYPGDCPLGGDWPRHVPSIDGADGSGAIDPILLHKLVEFFAERGHPILINFNYGTTFKGAYDNIEECWAHLRPVFDKCGLLEREITFEDGRTEKRCGYWFHVDGALGAAYMPFIERAHLAGSIAERGPEFDFRLPYVSSISMSGHKWSGAPWPCGIYMTRRKYQLQPPDNPEYIGALDSTFAGSRNGLSALILWSYLTKNSHDKQIEKALVTQKMAAYAHQRLIDLERELKTSLWVKRSPLSLTVRFKQVSADLIAKYSLSGESFYSRGIKQTYNHLYAMAHVTEDTIDRFIEDLRRPCAFPEQEGDELGGAPQTADESSAEGAAAR